MGYGSVPATGDPFLVTLAQKTMFSPQSLSIYCKNRTEVAEEAVQQIVEVLKDLGNADLNLGLEGLRAIP